MRRTSGLSAANSAIYITSVVALTAGCSDNSSKDKSTDTNTGITATQICDGTLDTSAAAALQRLTGAKKFDELTGTNEAGEPNAFSVSRAVKHLHDDYAQRSACLIYKTDDDSGHPLVDIRFSASSSSPSGSEEETDSDRVRYPMGTYALAGRNGVDLFFRCTTKATDNASVGDTEYVKAEMYAVANRMHGNNINEDRMTLLNSISRAVAETAGCASKAKLPAQVPEPSSAS